jgi:hypothetical protein
MVAVFCVDYLHMKKFNLFNNLLGAEQEDSIERTSEKITAAIILAIAVSYWIYFIHTILMLSPEQRVQFVPDDAFYYLTLVRNFVDQGQWTFDSGVSLTSGFHPLYAYALAAVYFLTHASTENFVTLAVLLSVTVALAAVIIAIIYVIRVGRLLPAMLFLLFILSPNISLNTFSALEWGWVVFISALYCIAFWGLNNTQSGIFAIVVFGFIGSLARTDFGILPFSLAVASMLTSTGRKQIKGVLAGLSATILGVLLCLLHNYLLTGQWMQSSALMKSLWRSTYGVPSPIPILSTILTLFGEISTPTLLLIVVILTGIMAAYIVIFGCYRFFLRYISQENNCFPVSNTLSTAATIWLGSLFTICGYITFYSLNTAALQPWYTAGFVVPIFLAINLPFTNIRSRHPANIPVLLLLTLLMLIRLSQSYSSLTTYGFFIQPKWPHQMVMFQAGRFLQEAKFQHRVGSWNAGIIGFYEGGHVVNLDGLVNNDIYNYVKRKELPKYIDERRIRYILDFENMFSSQKLRERGGYDSPAFLDRLKVIRKFDKRSWGWHHLTLYKIDSEKL